MSTWYYLKDGTQTGPVETDALKSLIASGAVKPEAMVWREGMSAWAPARTQPEFSGAAASVPPQPPTATAACSCGSCGKPEEFTPDAVDVEQNKVMAILAYIIFLIPLLAARQSRFAMFHCNQGLILFIVCIVGWIVLTILGFVLAFIPIIGLILDVLLCMGFGFGILALVIVGIINSAKGVCKPLPVIGSLFTLVK